jgi:hypothetical protein
MIFNELIETLSQELVDKKFSRMAALTVFAEYSPRIFEKGIASDGTSIGEYVDGPYKKKRSELGREVGFVNLELTGTFRRDLQPTLTGTVGFAFSNDTNLKISEGLEKRYGKEIFALTEEEQELFKDTIADLIIP